jgi:phosphatidylserine/phosphatidylglycerophosphate/cardiolipin synthase-like enzyme
MKKISRILVLVFAFILIGTSIWAAYRPAPDNRNLSEVFNDIRVEGGEGLTRVRFIPENDDAWYARWKIIKEAKETIDCTYYIVDKDIFGQAFLGLLLNKARHGVRIRLMVDGRVFHMPTMNKMPDKFQELAAFPNVEIKLYNSIKKSLSGIFKDFKRLVASNHDKIIIVDGYTCLIGGRNIGADYFSQNGENDIVYRDSDILMQGKEAAGQLKKAFDDEWQHLKNKVVKPDLINFKDQLARVDLAYRVMSRYMQGRGLYDPDKSRMSGKLRKALLEMNEEIVKFKKISSYAGFRMFRGERKKPVKILDKHSYIGALNGITPNLLKMIEVCKKEIIIQNPYLVITPAAEASLKRAAERGVKIIFHTNSAESTDSLFPQAFLMDDWKRILKTMPGARILVAPGINERIHAKTFVFDGIITIIGSYNMDPLSEDINSEVVAAVHDKPFATQQRLRILGKDTKKHVEYRIELDDKGNIIKSHGPESHVDPKTIKKLNFLRKLQWLRPII